MILGATGRLGRAFHALWSAGHWPATGEPIWQYRQGSALTGQSLFWDMTTPPPVDARLGRANGVIVLAGVTMGTEDDLARNTDLALAGIALARAHDLGPVLICSSAAVYGRAHGPQDETAPCQPANAYGQAKLAMEAAVAGSDAICLRLANVAGSDQLFGAATKGRVRLDQFSDGTAPERAYIGPLSLARTMLALIERGVAQPLPRLINIAAPRPVRMDALLTAAGVPFDWTPAPPSAMASVTLDTARLQSIAPLTPDTADPAHLVAEARAGRWRPA